jgi:PHD/YefM family antitoxin component YafN of YafNO toxin-antitoxin module
MKTIDVTEATGSLAEYARNLSDQPILITEAGRAVAALLPVDDEDLDALALSTNPRFIAILETARAERRAGRSLSSEDVRRELGLKSS